MVVGLPADPVGRMLGLKPQLERALDVFHQRQPTVPLGVSYCTGTCCGDARGSGNIDLLLHPYVAASRVRSGGDQFDSLNDLVLIGLVEFDEVGTPPPNPDD